MVVTGVRSAVTASPRLIHVPPASPQSVTPDKHLTIGAEVGIGRGVDGILIVGCHESATPLVTVGGPGGARPMGIAARLTARVKQDAHSERMRVTVASC